ncbi:methionine--tRNA ligase [Liberiplasma polymorphum]|uniref:methionine--tRNA ligase n=1 Tax=Liberiplasma polymorphum TaxID=3374570 RepID=UPI003770B8AD
MSKTFYITTPIYYPSGKLHIGNTYTTVLCDTLTRYKKLRGFDTYYLTGMDEHGKKIETVASERNLSPIDHVTEMANETRALWDKLNISYDDFIRTTEKRHKTVVQKIFEQLLEQGDIYLGTYKGYYCMPCESFYTETQLSENHTCPDCGRETSQLEEESYFFKLSKYQKKLLHFIEDKPDFITPETRKNEVIAFIKQGLNDLSVSRTTFDWGIKVVSNPKHVVYVWIDALSNYISALGYGTDQDQLYQKYWNGQEVVHVVGKDILRFHAIYWPIMLMALDIPVNFKLHAHGFYMMKDGKMSKSKGSVIYPDVVLKHYGLDELRYFLLRELPYGGDGVFSPEAFIERINFDLANDFGNLLNRTISMINKYFEGTISGFHGDQTEFDQDLQNTITDVVLQYKNNMNTLKLSLALQEVWRLISRTNKYIDETMPWVLAKDEANKDKLETVLYHLAESLRHIGILLKPILLDAAPALFKQLNVPDNLTTWDALEFGVQKEYQVIKKPIPLFPRLDVEEEVEKLKKIIQGKEEIDEKEITIEEITIEDFVKLDLRIGEIIHCEVHPDADKLLVSKIDIGKGKIRQIVSGIAKHYEPKDLIGKKVVVVTNLKPVKLRGVLSEGMLLAGSNKNTLEVLTTEKLSAGDIVK